MFCAGMMTQMSTSALFGGNSCVILIGLAMFAVRRKRLPLRTVKSCSLATMSPPARTVMRPSVNLWVKIVVSLAGAAGTAGETPSPPDGVTGDVGVVGVGAAAGYRVDQ